MHDGFVLHHIQSQLPQHHELVMAEVSQADIDNLAIIGLTTAQSRAANNTKISITQWLSCRLSYICAHEYATILGIILIVGLVVAATILEWSVIGQLLCNLPPSIVETFIMIALITSQNLDETTQHRHLEELEITRDMLTRWVARYCIAQMTKNDRVPKVKTETCLATATY